MLLGNDDVVFFKKEHCFYRSIPQNKNVLLNGKLFGDPFSSFSQPTHLKIYHTLGRCHASVVIFVLPLSILWNDRGSLILTIYSLFPLLIFLSPQPFVFPLWLLSGTNQYICSVARWSEWVMVRFWEERELLRLQRGGFLDNCRINCKGNFWWSDVFPNSFLRVPPWPSGSHCWVFWTNTQVTSSARKISNDAKLRIPACLAWKLAK